MRQNKTASSCRDHGNLPEGSKNPHDNQDFIEILERLNALMATLDEMGEAVAAAHISMAADQLLSRI